MPDRYLGRTLGKYRVEELVGSGGFAWVYRGFDPELDVPVALKVLKPQFAGDPKFEERFRREASTAARLRHPNIIKIYAVGRNDDAVYFSMDYLPSGLAARLETMNVVPEEFALRMGIDVARALGFAHREGVIHRDIKVDNILFDVHGNAVVADFGIARAVSGYTQQTGTNMVVGTPQYFAPEQARAKPLDGRADLYSLGVSLFRSVTGQLPFDGDDWYEIARQHVEEEPPGIRALNPAISPAFEAVILRCMAKHPDDRPATGEQLADELAAALALPRDQRTSATFPVVRTASESPTMVSAPAGARRPPRLVALLPVAVAAAALGAVAFPFVMRELAGAGGSGVRDSATVAPAIAAPTAAPDTSFPDSNPPGAVDAGTPAAGAAAPSGSSASRPRATPRTGVLVATGPEGATLTVNGRAVGGHLFRADSAAPGRYLIRAVLPTIPGCETARDESTVQVRAGAPTRVTLSPRPCGLLAINARNAGEGSQYVLVEEGHAPRRGALPLDGPLVLPVGTYTLRAEKPGCNGYESTVSVSVDSRTTPRVVTFVFDCPDP